MPKEKFNSLVKDEFATLQEKLKHVEYGDRIMNRLKGANRLGDTEKLWLLCQEIKLPVGKVEQEAVRARNYMAHGSSKIFNEAAYEEMIEATLAYRTLFNRILLKILGYEGKYTDFSTPGYPERSINQPLRGESPR